MVAFRLPVSGLAVVCRPVTGSEDILLAERSDADISLALALVQALVQLEGGGPVSWPTLPISDLDAALLRLRQSFIGDHIRTSMRCAGPAGGCQARIDIAFQIGDYLAHHAPARMAGVSPAAEPGWFQFDGTRVTFRHPNCADLLMVAGQADAARALAQSCIRPANAPAPLQRRAARALARLAPSLVDDLDGACPHCAARVHISFDPQLYVLSEFRARAIFVYEEVNLIATQYRWSEQEILALPQTRRARYAEFAHEARVRH